MTAVVAVSTPLHAEVFVRWDLPAVPSAQALGVTTLVVPATQPAAVRAAIDRGYRVIVEVDAASAPGYKAIDGVAGLVSRGALPADQIARLSRGTRAIRVADDRGKWPHIRTNWVTRNKDVLQVTNRSAQPWLENNQALVRIGSASATTDPPLITYTWQPDTVSDLDQGPRLENYLVAIAEAGSFGADLVLPLHERFERALLMGSPEARADWNELRAAIDFYAWNAVSQHRPVANVGVVTADPFRSFETLNLLARHNLPFVVLPPAGVTPQALSALDLLILLDEPAGGRGVLDELTRRGGRIVEAKDAPSDPNTFALEMRQRLGSERRIVDLWNGITVLIAPYASPSGDRLLLTALNYAAQPLPVQVRVRGTFTELRYEAPGHPAMLLPFEHRNGGTEFVLPALKIGARIFLTRLP